MASLWTPYPRDLAFASHFIYPSPAPDQATRNLKSFLLGVKTDRYAGAPPQRLLSIAIARIAAQLQDPTCPYRDYFGPDVMLVPAPGHGKMLKNALSTGRALCIELEGQGLGKMVACIERTAAVTKSATAAPGDRPVPQQHYESMRIEKGVETPTDILIVDDIITRGSTQVAAAARLSEAYPEARIRGFGIARTGRHTGKNADPVVGIISVAWGVPHRSP